MDALALGSAAPGGSLVGELTADQVATLVRAATLAPFGHNTQPWRFRPTGSAIELYADLTRRLPVVDPDDHALYMSLGDLAYHGGSFSRRLTGR